MENKIEAGGDEKIFFNSSINGGKYGRVSLVDGGAEEVCR